MISRSLLTLSRSFFARSSKLLMPAFSPTMEQGNIVKWKIKEGDQINEGDSLVDIETDKATLSLDSTEAGFLAEILKKDGIKEVKVGEQIATLVPSKDDLKDFKKSDQGAKAEPKSQKTEEKPQKTEEKPQKTEKTESSNEKPQKSAPKQAKEEPAPSQEKPKPKSGGKLPAHTTVTLPALSPTMDFGLVSEWMIKEGQKLSSGDTVAKIETDKSTMDFDFLEDGYVAKILVKAGGEKLSIGAPLFVVVRKKEDVDAFKDFVPDGAASEAAPPEKKEKKEAPSKKEEVAEKKEEAPAKKEEKPKQQKEIAKEEHQVSEKSETRDRKFVSPAAQKTLKDAKIDPQSAKISGSGPSGRVLKHDAETFLSKGAAAQKEQAPSKQEPRKTEMDFEGEFKEFPLSSIRKVIGKRLLEAKQKVPHYYLEIEISMGQLIKFRKQITTDSQKKISVTDLIMKAMALACIDVPEVNSQLKGDSVVKFKDCDVSLAVDIGDALITPIIRKVNTKSISEIAKESADLIARAKSRSLKPNEYEGGNICLSNLGMMGIKSFSAIINPPQSSILAVGKTEKRPVYDEKAPGGFKWEDMMSVTLSADHRVIDGAVGAKWLQAFQKYMENPVLMLV